MVGAWAPGGSEAGEVGERDKPMPFLGWGNWGTSPPFLMGKGGFGVLRGTEESREHSSW